MYAAKVKMAVVLVDRVFARTLALSTEQHFAEMHVPFPRRHSEEVQLTSSIQGLFSPCS